MLDLDRANARRRHLGRRVPLAGRGGRAKRFPLDTRKGYSRMIRGIWLRSMRGARRHDRLSRPVRVGRALARAFDRSEHQIGAASPRPKHVRSSSISQSRRSRRPVTSHSTPPLSAQSSPLNTTLPIGLQHPQPHCSTHHRGRATGLRAARPRPTGHRSQDRLTKGRGVVDRR